MYISLYRRYRPQKFSDMVGQGAAVSVLRESLKEGRLGHAYLFSGPRGCGKTSAARLVAKGLNCQNRASDGEPCGECEACTAIAQSEHLDVIEIDGASNRGINEIRDLKSHVNLKPLSAPYKIYIIDEVHMLTEAAFNALLKTLEEPPANVVFLLATTDVHKVPVTILSRCQRFDLRRISLKEIVGRLQEISKAEKWKVSPEALLAIARGAEGGLRDAESALDQLIAFRGEKIEEADVLDVFGLVSWATITQLAAAILKGEAAEALQIVGDLDAGGRDLQRLLLELLVHFRNILIVRHAPKLTGSLDLTEAQRAGLQEQAELADGEKLLRIVDILTEAANQARMALSRRTVVEVALLKATRAASVVSLDELIAQIQALPAGDAAPPPPAEPSSSTAQVSEAPPRGRARPLSDADEFERLKQRWPAVLAAVTETAQLAAPYFKEAVPLRIEGERAILGFPAEFADYIKRVDNARARQAIVRALGHAVGRAIGVKYEALENGHSAPAQEAAAGEPPARPKAVITPSLRKALENDPVVLQTMEAFGATVMDIRE